MYSVTDIKEGLGEPYKIVRELNVLYHRRFRTRNYNTEGADIFVEDWDNLILLDACRYDEFENIWQFGGSLEFRQSRGSSSNEFVRGNFQGRKLLNTVCVTANGWYLKVDDVQVHDMIPLIEEKYRDDETGAILPETVSRHAVRAGEQYPNKRLVVHFMQPHTPYIGPTGREHFDGFRTRSDLSRTGRSADKYDVEKLRTAYRENLEIVVDEVQSLLSELDGKTVISADHGEMLGERLFPIPVRDYMHPHGIYNDVLTKVPWLVHTDGDRRSIVAEKPEERSEPVESDTVEAHLKDLGYL